MFLEKSYVSSQGPGPWSSVLIPGLNPAQTRLLCHVLLLQCQTNPSQEVDITSWTSLIHI